MMTPMCGALSNNQVNPHVDLSVWLLAQTPPMSVAVKLVTLLLIFPVIHPVMSPVEFLVRDLNKCVALGHVVHDLADLVVTCQLRCPLH
jgi:hypothetical protein